MARYGMVIDLSRCMGCRSCVEACKVENNTGQNMFFMYVFRWENGDYPHVKMSYLPRPCMHCSNAPCVKVCPVGARHKREDGIVLTDYDRCIGCRICAVACPYGVNNFNWKKPSANQYYDWKHLEGEDTYGSGSIQDEIKEDALPYRNPDHDRLYGGRLVSGSGHNSGIMEKCTFCVHRVDKGMLPACVANCPVKTLHFGDLDDPNSEVSHLLGHKPSFRLLDEVGTQPSVFYIGAPQPQLHANELQPAKEVVG